MSQPEFQLNQGYQTLFDPWVIPTGRRLKNVTLFAFIGNLFIVWAANVKRSVCRSPSSGSVGFALIGRQERDSIMPRAIPLEGIDHFDHLSIDAVIIAEPPDGLQRVIIP